jgi:hypothetical protein
MNRQPDTKSRLRRLLVPLFLAATIAPPAATAGTDTGIGIPAGRDGVELTTHYQYPRSAAAGTTAFQWGDAGIGAGFALGLTTLAGGGILLARRQRGTLSAS